MATQRPRPKLPAPLRWLLAIDLFVGVTAVLGGVGLVADPSGRNVGLSLSMLEHSPFDTFLVPGLVLAVVIGGAALLASLAHLLRWRFAGQASLFAGLLLVGWILVQVLMIRELSWLHGVYFVLGLGQIALALRALGLASPRAAG